MRISDWSSDVCSSDLGGNHDSRTTYRGTARRASLHHRSGRTSPDRSGVADGAFESCGTGSDDRSMAGLIVRYEGGVGIAGRRFALSAWLRMAELCGLGRFEGEGRRSEARRVGKEGVSTCSSRGSRKHKKKKK